MCGIALLVGPGAREHAATFAAMLETVRPARRRRGAPPRRRGPARHAAAADRRPRPRRAAVAVRRRPLGCSATTARSTTTTSCGPSSTRWATSRGRSATPRSCSRSFLAVGRGRLSRAAGRLRLRHRRPRTPAAPTSAATPLGVKPLYWSLATAACTSPPRSRPWCPLGATRRPRGAARLTTAGPSRARRPSCTPTSTCCAGRGHADRSPTSTRPRPSSGATLRGLDAGPGRHRPHRRRDPLRRARQLAHPRPRAARCTPTASPSPSAPRTARTCVRRRLCADLGVPHEIIDLRPGDIHLTTSAPPSGSRELTEYGDIINAVVSVPLFRRVHEMRRQDRPRRRRLRRAVRRLRHVPRRSATTSASACSSTRSATCAAPSCSASTARAWARASRCGCRSSTSRWSSWRCACPST